MSCIFCSIVSGEIAGSIVAENEDAIAIADLAPVAPTHILVIPKVHYANLDAYVRASDPAAVAALMAFAARLGSELEGGYRLVVNSGERGGQSVAHLHLHVIGGRAMQWPPG